MTPIFQGRIEKGKLILETPNRFRVYLSKHEGKPVEIIVRKKKSQRSLNQNNWYWSCIVAMISDYLGYTKEECHFALRERLARNRERERNGLVITESTATMDTVRFAKYCDEIVRWSEEFLHLYIPKPGEMELNNLD